jgi:formylglycine-generating enzyme required for sulfatase activity
MIFNDSDFTKQAGNISSNKFGRKMKKVFLVLVILFVLLNTVCFANRLALVIGNSDYEGIPLKNPVNDANDIATTLRELDFEVIKRTNLNKRELEEIAETFENRVTSNDVALFYYSGHGLQVDGINYLIPLNANIDEENDVRYEAIELNRIISKLEKANLNIIILDACRDNPFKGFRSSCKGLAQISTNKVGTFIAYSTGPGNVAVDGTGRNSPYTKNLIKKMKTDLKIEDTFKEVRKSVIDETSGRQVPWDSSCLADDFYFCISCAPQTTEPKETRVELRIQPDSSFENMVFVKGGTMQMDTNIGSNFEKPIHSITVSDFYIGETEVTQKEWKETMKFNPSNFKGDNLPVENISWYDAVEFCNKKSIKVGLVPCYSISGEIVKCNFSANGYRLPTKVEQIYAARGGMKSNGYRYSGSNNLDYVGWYWRNSGDSYLSGDWAENRTKNNNCHIQPVGQKIANELGIYDMSGNIWEWSNDSGGNYSTRNQKDLHEAEPDRWFFGGCVINVSVHCNVTSFSFGAPDQGIPLRGFRLSRSAE